MRRRLLFVLLACGCGGPASPSVAPVSIEIPPAEPAPAPAATPEASASVAPRVEPVASAQDLSVLDRAINGEPAATGGLGALNLSAGGGGPITPGPGAGGPVVLSKPFGQATVGAPTVKGTISNAPAVVAGMQAGFRRCFNKGLQQDPSMHGLAIITAKIGPSGEVLAVSPKGTGLTNDVLACVASRVNSAQFAPPAGGSATLIIPVTFKNSYP